MQVFQLRDLRDKDDNRIANLVAMSRSQHHKNHHEPWEQRIRELEEVLLAGIFGG